MKQSYVLDENIAVCAATGKNERGQDDPSSLRLMQVLFKRCDALSFSNELYRKRVSKLSDLKTAGIPFSQAALTQWKAFIVTQDKLKFIPEPTELESEGAIPEDDRYVVRLAVATDSSIVTTDGRLVQRLRDASVTKKYGLRLMRPEEAIAPPGNAT